ncbi:MAG: NAD(P)/FAD-dependent oxidoreductase [Persicimonas sp.]
MRRIVVLGCGFGGFRAARELQQSLSTRRRVQLTVVSDRSHFLYTPLLPHLATGELDVAHITFPLRAEFDKSTELLIERVERIDLERRVLVSDNREIDFDYLLVASGAEVDWGEDKQWQAHTLTCHSARDATRIQERLASVLRDAAQLESADQLQRRLTFVVGGAGPSGIELAAQLLTTLRSELLPMAAEPIAQALRLIVVEQQQRILPDWPRELGELVRAHLRTLGMEFRTGTSVVGRSAEQVELSTGEIIDADNFLWCGGVRVPALVTEAGFKLDASGRIAVDSTLQALQQPRIYAIGDVAGPPGDIPQLGQVATQQASVAARNIIANLSGRARRDWEYQPRGHLLSLGRRHAVAFWGDTPIEGRAASALYRVVHTALMPTALKKAGLAKDWLFSAAGRSGASGLLGEPTVAAQLEAEDSPP